MKEYTNYCGVFSIEFSHIHQRQTSISMGDPFDDKLELIDTAVH